MSASKTQRLPLLRLLALLAFSFGLTLTTSTLEPALLGQKILAIAPNNSASTFGLLTFIGLVAAAITQPAAGWLSDKMNTRLPFLWVGAGVVSVGLVLMGFAATFGSVLLCLVIIQMGLNLAQGPWLALMPDFVPNAQRGMASGIKGLFDLSAAITGRLTTGAFMARIETLGATAIFASISFPIASLFGLLLAGTWAINRLRQTPVIGTPKNPSHPNTQNTFAEPQKISKLFIVWCLNRFLFWCAFIGSSTFLLFYATQVLGMSAATAQRYIGQLTAVIGGALLICFLPSGWLADKLGRRVPLVTGGLLAATGTACIVFTRDQTLIIACALLIGIGVSLYLSSSVAALADVVPQTNSARYIGIANIATACGSGLARLGGGVLVDGLNAALHSQSIGYTALLLIAAGLFALSSGVGLWLRSAANSPNRVPASATA